MGKKKPNKSYNSGSKRKARKEDKSWIWLCSLLAIFFVFVIVCYGRLSLRANGSYQKTISNIAEKIKLIKYSPPTLKSLIVHPESTDNYFDFILDTQEEPVENEEKLEPMAKELIDYFFLGITLPSEDLWVNLNSVRQNAITSPRLALTDIGKVLLEADLRLKKDCCRFTDPRTRTGKEYWSKLQARLNEEGLSTSQLPIGNRFWIIPAEASVEEDKDNHTVTIVKSRLKVCLQQEYLELQNNQVSLLSEQTQDPRARLAQDIADFTMKETVLPSIQEEVNQGKAYARLRQVYNSLILAEYYKQKYHSGQGLYSRLINRGYIEGLESNEPWASEDFYNAYVKSCQEGEYRLSQQEYDPYLASMVQKYYFYGGIMFAQHIAPKLKVIPKASSYMGNWLAKFFGHNDINNPYQEKALPIYSLARHETHEEAIRHLAEMTGKPYEKLIRQAGFARVGRNKDKNKAARARMSQLAKIKDKQPSEITEIDKKYLVETAAYFGLYPKSLEASDNEDKIRKYILSLNILASAEVASLDLPDISFFALSAIDEIGTSFFAHELGHILLSPLAVGKLFNEIEEKVDAQEGNKFRLALVRSIQEVHAWQLILDEWEGLSSLRPNILLALIDCLINNIEQIEARNNDLEQFVKEHGDAINKDLLEKYSNEIKRAKGESFFNLIGIRELRENILESRGNVLVNINESIQKVSQLYAEHRRFSEIQAQLEPTLPDIYANPVKIRHIWTNLFRNSVYAISEAIEENRTRKGRITIKTQDVREHGKEFIEITFSDNGKGIPQELQDENRLFQKYVTTKKSGTGLGLYLIDQTVKELGGTIEVQSELGKGTTFIIRLPIGQGEFANGETIHNLFAAIVDSFFELKVPNREEASRLQHVRRRFIAGAGGRSLEYQRFKWDRDTDILYYQIGSDDGVYLPCKEGKNLIFTNGAAGCNVLIFKGYKDKKPVIGQFHFVSYESIEEIMDFMQNEQIEDPIFVLTNYESKKLTTKGAVEAHRARLNIELSYPEAKMLLYPHNYDEYEVLDSSVNALGFGIFESKQFTGQKTPGRTFLWKDLERLPGRIIRLNNERFVEYNEIVPIADDSTQPPQFGGGSGGIDVSQREQAIRSILTKNPELADSAPELLDYLEQKHPGILEAIPEAGRLSYVRGILTSILPEETELRKPAGIDFRTIMPEIKKDE